MENSLLFKLKEDTKECHQNVEKVLVAELKSLSSLEEYGRLLLKLHNFYQALEQQVHVLIDESILPDIKSRKHVGKLKSDLLHLGFEVDEAQNPFSDKINGISYALGILYVMEGSTLGGQVISSMLKKRLPVTDENILSYFNSYGENTPMMWNSFRIHIENAPIPIDENEMTQGAKDTFEHLRLWLRSN